MIFYDDVDTLITEVNSSETMIYLNISGLEIHVKNLNVTFNYTITVAARSEHLPGRSSIKLRELSINYLLFIYIYIFHF